MRRSILLAVLLLAACAGSDAPTAAEGPVCGDAPASSELPPAGTSAPGTAAHVRFFNFVGPQMQSASIDVCVQAEDGAWTGPLYRNTHTYPKYANVAPYVDLPPGSYRVRVVPWGAAECEATLDAVRDDVDLAAAFEADQYRTVVLSAWVMPSAGVPVQPLAAHVLNDKTGFGDHELSVRILNEDPAIPSLDVWKAPKNADPATWLPMMEAIPFGQVGVATDGSPFGATDADGYLHQHPKDWPETLPFNLALCPHASKDACWVVGSQTIAGNVTYFAARTPAGSWSYEWVSDGAVLFDANQPHMTQSERWW